MALVNTTCLMRRNRQEIDEPLGLKGSFARQDARLRRVTFKELFCSRFGCSTHEFHELLFARCLYRHALPFARILSQFIPEFFKEDHGFIRDLASASSHGEVRMELDRFRGRNLRDERWLRKRLSLRVSGKRVLTLSKELFEQV